MTYTSAPPAPAPARHDLATTVRGNWAIALVPVIVLVAIAGVIALARPAQYTAQSRLAIGELNTGTQGIPGFVTAAVGLSSAYSRAVDAPQVIGPVAKQLGVPPSEVAGDVSASPITDSPLFTVQAQTGDAAKAVRMANASAASLVRYISAFNRKANVQARTITQYRAASATSNQLQLDRDRALRAYQKKPNAANGRALVQASTALDAAKLRQQALGNVFGANVAGRSASDLLQVLAPASRADSDRGSVAAKLLFAGLLAGLALGAALLAARARRPGAGLDL